MEEPMKGRTTNSYIMKKKKKPPGNPTPKKKSQRSSQEMTGNKEHRKRTSYTSSKGFHRNLRGQIKVREKGF